MGKIRRIVNAMPYTDGAHEVLTALSRKGFKVGLLSARLSLVTERIRKEIGIDAVLANELTVKNGLLTGGGESKRFFQQQRQGFAFDSKEV